MASDGIRLRDKKRSHVDGYLDRIDRIEELAENEELPEDSKSNAIDRATIELRQRLRKMQRRANRTEEELEEELNQDTSDVLFYSVSVDVERPKLSELEG